MLDGRNLMCLVVFCLMIGTGADLASAQEGMPEMTPEMQAVIDKERNAMFDRYQDRAPRHTMQVDFKAYFWRLDRIRRRGGKIARESGFALPIAPRAAGIDTDNTLPEHRAAS